MKITVVGRHMSVPADLQELAEKKLAKLDKYFATEEKATVTFSRKRNRENIEITIAAANTLFRCETDDATFRNAIDRAVDTIDRQIHFTYKTNTDIILIMMSLRKAVKVWIKN